jgi:hypothetical protein
MKKKILGYFIITTILLISLLAGFFSLRIVRKGETYTEVTFTDDFSHTIINNTQFSFSQTQFDYTNFNDSIRINNLISYNPIGILSIGSVKNSTNNDHGFVEFYSITPSLTSYDVQLSSTYLDTNTINETEYLKGQIYNGTLDGQGSQPTIALLKKVNDLYYEIELLQLEIPGIIYNSTFIVPTNLIETVSDFGFTDVDEDDKPELILYGTNDTETQNVLLEFTYNEVSKQFDLNNFYNWSIDSSVIVDLQQFVDENKIYFIATNLIAGTPIKTNVLAFSMDINPVRSFSLESNLTIDYVSHGFRAYSSKLVNDINDDNQILALFGTFIENGLDNYPYCLKLSFDSGVPSIVDEYRIEQTPLYSFDGLIVDIDLDGEDEIIMTTYDLLAETISDFSVITGSTFKEFDYGSTNLRRIRTSATLTIDSKQIGVFLGKNPSSQDSFAFHSLDYIPFQVKNSGEILRGGNQNNITIETITLTGQARDRSDIEMEIGIDEISGSHRNVSSFPSISTIDIPDLINTSITNDLVITIFKNGDTIQEFFETITVDYNPEFTIKSPESIVIIRDYSNHVYFDLEINNRLSRTLNTNVSILIESTMNTIEFQRIVTSGINYPSRFMITFVGTTPPSTFEESLLITFETNVGSYTMTLQITVTNEFIVIPSDLFTIFCIFLVGTIIGYFVFMRLSFNQTKHRIDDYYQNNKEIDLEFPIHTNRAINSLINDYLSKQDWQAGIKIAKDYKSPYLWSFNKYKIRDYLKQGQNQLQKGKFAEALASWEVAQETLEEIGTHQQIDTLNWLMSPLKNIVKALTEKKGSEKATLLQKEFENLSDMKDLRKVIFNIVLDIPIHLVAEELGLALRDTEELQTSLHYLQLAYQSAPAEEKNRIVTEITSLIGLGVTPTEFSMPVNHEEIRERISKRTIRCFSCGEERTNVNEPCSNCEIDTVQCSVCKLPISFGSDYLECYHCQNVAHREHLLEWVKVKGTCPICQQKLTVDKLAVAQEKD